MIIRAGRGVVLATGGFEWDPELVRSFLRGPMTSPASIPTNTGDGLLMAMRAGAALDNMPQAWWAPVIEIPGDISFGRPHATLLNRERTLPRSILVNKLGRRFTNEAANYNALGGAFHQLDATRFDYANLPCWLIFDAGYLARYGFRNVRPAGQAPAWMTRADRLDRLAAAIGAPADALTATVTRWNANVESGDDPDFHVVAARTTGGAATPPLAARLARRSARSTSHRTTRSKCAAGPSAPAAARAPTCTGGCSTPGAR